MHPSHFCAEHAPLVPPEGDTLSAGRRFCAGLASQPAREREFALSADIHNSYCPANRRAPLGDPKTFAELGHRSLEPVPLFGGCASGLCEARACRSNCCNIVGWRAYPNELSSSKDGGRDLLPLLCRARTARFGAVLAFSESSLGQHHDNAWLARLLCLRSIGGRLLRCSRLANVAPVKERHDPTWLPEGRSTEQRNLLGAGLEDEPGGDVASRMARSRRVCPFSLCFGCPGRRCRLPAATRGRLCGRPDRPKLSVEVAPREGNRPMD